MSLFRLMMCIVLGCILVSCMAGVAGAAAGQDLSFPTTTPTPTPSYTACPSGCQCLFEYEIPTVFGESGRNYVKCSETPCGKGTDEVVRQYKYCFRVPSPAQQPVVVQPQPPVPGASTGSLSISSSPSGASVTIDGQYRGTTSVTISGLSPGSHSLRLSLAGYQDASQSASVSAGGIMAVSVSLVPLRQGVSPGNAGEQVGVVPLSDDVGVIQLPEPSRPALRPERCTRTFIRSGTLSSSGGKTTCTFSIRSGDNIAVLDIPEGTRADDAGNTSLTSLSITPLAISEIPVLPGDDTHVSIGRAYRCLPDHATFDPPALLIFSLGQEEWDASDPGNLTIRETSAGGGKWEGLPTTLDPVRRTASAQVSHFSTIGLFSQNVAVNPPVNGTGSDHSINGLIRQAVGSGTPKPFLLSSLIPDKVATVAAVVAGTGIALIGTTIAARLGMSHFLEKIWEFLREYIGVYLVKLTKEKEIEKRGIRPLVHDAPVFAGISGREFGIIGVSTFLFALAFLLRERLVLDIVIILVYVCVAGFAGILHDLAHKVCARRCGCSTEYQFWLLGMVTMFFTAGLLGNVFARPARNVIECDKVIPPEKHALISIAGPLASLGVAILSLFLIPLGGIFAIAGSAGFMINLVDCVYSLLPVPPMDGKEVYAWNKLVWAAVFLPMITFYLFVYLQS